MRWLACEAAIDAQRAILALNERRLAQNPAREIENHVRIAAGLPPGRCMWRCSFGTGINTGMVTAGLMGSDAPYFQLHGFRPRGEPGQPARRCFRQRPHHHQRHDL